VVVIDERELRSQLYAAQEAVARIASSLVQMYAMMKAIAHLAAAMAKEQAADEMEARAAANLVAGMIQGAIGVGASATAIATSVMAGFKAIKESNISSDVRKIEGLGQEQLQTQHKTMRESFAPQLTQIDAPAVQAQTTARPPRTGQTMSVEGSEVVSAPVPRSPRTNVETTQTVRPPYRPGAGGQQSNHPGLENSISSSQSGAIQPVESTLPPTPTPPSTPRSVSMVDVDISPDTPIVGHASANNPVAQTNPNNVAHPLAANEPTPDIGPLDGLTSTQRRQVDAFKLQAGTLQAEIQVLSGYSMAITGFGNGLGSMVAAPLTYQGDLAQAQSDRLQAFAQQLESMASVFEGAASSSERLFSEILELAKTTTRNSSDLMRRIWS
jgi:hypothetical protein